MAEKYLVSAGYQPTEVEVAEGPDGLRVLINGKWHNARMEQVGHSALYALLVDDHPHELFAMERAGGYEIVIGPDHYSIAVGATARRREEQAAPQDQTLAEHPAGGWAVVSPMTGVINEIQVKVGDKVAERDVLMMIEAMKMNNELRAQRAGVVQEIYVKVGQRVDLGMPLLLLRQD